MKIAVVFALMLVVGSAVARPNNKQKIINLIEKILDEKKIGARDEVVDPIFTSTVLKDLPEVLPFKLFENLGQFSDALDVADVNVEEVMTSVGAVESVFTGVSDKINEFFDPENPPSLLGALDFLNQEVVGLFNNPEANIWSHMLPVAEKLVQGTLRGTTGAEVNEVGCDFDGDENELLACVVNKLYLLNIAIEYHLEESDEALREKIQGEDGVKGCFKLLDYLVDIWERKQGGASEESESESEETEEEDGADADADPVKKLLQMLKSYKKRQPEAGSPEESSEEGGKKDRKLDAKKVLRLLKESVACSRRNVGVILSRFPAGMLPPRLDESSPVASPLPLPTLISLNSVLQHVDREAWFGVISVFATIDMIAIEEGLAVPERRKLEAFQSKMTRSLRSFRSP